MVKRTIRVATIAALALAGLALGGCDHSYYSGGTSYGYLGQRHRSCYDAHADHSDDVGCRTDGHRHYAGYRARYYTGYRGGHYGRHHGRCD